MTESLSMSRGEHTITFDIPSLPEDFLAVSDWRKEANSAAELALHVLFAEQEHALAMAEIARVIGQPELDRLLRHQS